MSLAVVVALVGSLAGLAATFLGGLWFVLGLRLRPIELELSEVKRDTATLQRQHGEASLARVELAAEFRHLAERVDQLAA